MRLRAFKAALVAFLILVASVVLVACLILDASPVWGKSPEVCSANADSVIQWTMYKNQGITKDQLLNAIDFDQIPKQVRKQMEREIRQAIDFIYKSDKTPLDNAKTYFFECLKSPEYGPETEV